MIVWTPFFQESYDKIQWQSIQRTPGRWDSWNCPSRIPCKWVKLCPVSRIPPWNIGNTVYQKNQSPPPHTLDTKNTKNTHILLSHIVFTNWGILHDLPCIGIYHDLRGFPVNKKPPQGFVANVAQGRAPMARFMPGVLGSLGSGVWGRFSNGWVVP